jgi:hypothetical protein
MRFEEIKKGKVYVKTLKNPAGGGRKSAETLFYNMLIVEKKDETQEILASIVPKDGGQPTAPAWYPKEQFQRWRPKD